MLTPQVAEHILKTYQQAWEQQDSDLILTIFLEDATYHERVLKKAMQGHEEIRAYWDAKVCEEQSNISFQLLHYYLSGNTLIAEWDATFDSTEKEHRTHIREVAIIEVAKEKIVSLREYWHSESI